jgi:hypothetical protein
MAANMGPRLWDFKPRAGRRAQAISWGRRLYLPFTKVPGRPRGGVAKRTKQEHYRVNRKAGAKGRPAMFDEIIENIQDVVAFAALSVFTVTVLVWGNVIVELATA